MLEDVLTSWGGTEVTAMELYSFVFKLGYGYLQKQGKEDAQNYKANAIAYMRNEGSDKGKYRVLFDDTFEETLKEAQEYDFCIVNGLSYFGRKNKMEHASKMFAMIFDLDGVTEKTLEAFLSGCIMADAYPLPNFIALSGHGVHLYYVFDEPIPLYPNIKVQLKEFKYALTERIWNPYTSTIKARQTQGINQGFRVIGGKTKKGAPESRVRAFRMSEHPITLKKMSEYVPEAMVVDERKLFRESKMSLAAAKEKYPEWYEKVVVKKDKTPKRWKIEEKVHGNNPYALYDWWKSKINEGAAFHHRYFCLMCLAIYGAKCNVPEEKVRQDAYDFVPFLNALNPQEPFTKEDADSALECFDLKYITFPIKDMIAISNIEIEKNKRNYRKQADHLARARAVQDVDYPDGSWRNKNGRPKGSGTKENDVREYMKEHPDASISQIANELHISRSTVYKYKKSLNVVTDRKVDFDYIVKLPNGSEILIERDDIYNKDRMKLMQKYIEYMKKHKKL